MNALERAHFLCQESNSNVLNDLLNQELGPAQTLTILSKLRQTYSAEEAGALLSLAQLRKRAKKKFPEAERLFFTTESLEQSTTWQIACFRAQWIDRRAPSGPILDLGCGIGGDLLALAQHRQVIAYEIDPVRLTYAKANAKAMGMSEQIEFRLADWTADLRDGHLPVVAAAFADPARRVDGRRVFSLYQMLPPLDTLLALQRKVPALGIKAMSGVKDAELPECCDVSFISHEGICKESILWFGVLRPEIVLNRASDEGSVRRAHVYVNDDWLTVESLSKKPPLGSILPGMTLHEPDPALIRAGAFAELCVRLEAHLFDPQIAYLVSSRERRDPLVQSFAIDEVHPFGLKLLKRRLQEIGVGQVELKKRGFPIEPELLRPRLRLMAGGSSRTVFFTRQGEKRVMMIGRRL